MVGEPAEELGRRVLRGRAEANQHLEVPLAPQARIDMARPGQVILGERGAEQLLEVADPRDAAGQRPGSPSVCWSIHDCTVYQSSDSGAWRSGAR